MAFREAAGHLTGARGLDKGGGWGSSVRKSGDMPTRQTGRPACRWAEGTAIRAARLTGRHLAASLGATCGVHFVSLRAQRTRAVAGVPWVVGGSDNEVRTSVRPQCLLFSGEWMRSPRSSRLRVGLPSWPSFGLRRAEPTSPRLRLRLPSSLRYAATSRPGTVRLCWSRGHGGHAGR